MKSKSNHNFGFPDANCNLRGSDFKSLSKQFPVCKKSCLKSFFGHQVFLTKQSWHDLSLSHGSQIPGLNFTLRNHGFN